MLRGPACSTLFPTRRSSDLVDDARARFTHETVSNVQGQRTVTAAPEHTPRSDEGEGLILVSIIVAARTELFTVAHIGSRSEEHTSELQSLRHLVCRLLLDKK